MVMNNETEAANKLNLDKRTLQRYRKSGIGPRFTRLGLRRLGYTDEALDEWVKARTFVSVAAEYAATSAADAAKAA